MSRPEEIVSLLKKRILSQEYKQGDVLPKEEDLAHSFSVGRACIRECLSILKAQGYLESRRGKSGGTFVSNILDSPHIDCLYRDLILMEKMDLAELLSARLLIEPEAAKIACVRSTFSDIGFLEKCVHDFQGERQLESYIDFHNAIGRISGNGFYAISIRSFMKFIDTYTKTIGKNPSVIFHREDHKAIVEAFKNGDPNLAFEKMYIHISKAKETMLGSREEFYLAKYK